MDLNYLILAHKNLEQVERLVEALNGYNTRFFIHIDKKIAWKEIKNTRLQENGSVVILKDRFDVSWGGFSIVQATLALLKQATSKSKNGYFILLSGQDFPLENNELIHAFFDENPEREYLLNWKMPYEKWHRGGTDRINYAWFIDQLGYNASRMLFQFQKIGKLQRSRLLEIPPYGGSQWWSLTYNACRYVLEYIESNPNILQFFKYTLGCDEMFFQTILLNSPFRTNIINQNLRYIKFDDGKAHPNILDVNEFPAMLESSCLWARKFDFRVDGEILDKLELHVRSVHD